MINGFEPMYTTFEAPIDEEVNADYTVIKDWPTYEAAAEYLSTCPLGSYMRLTIAVGTEEDHVN
jgi:hypothetical protein